MEAGGKPLNDFLHQLRQSREKQYDRTKRPHSNPQYRDHDRRGAKDFRKTHTTRSTQDLSAVLGPALTSIQELLKETHGQIKRLASAEEKRAETEERKTDVLEKIADRLTVLAASVVGGGTNTEDFRTAGGQETQPMAKPAGKAEQDPSADEQEAEFIEGSAEETGEAKTCDEQETDPFSPEESSTSAREIVYDKIKKMRDDGMSFEGISRELEAQGVPTLSGKGRWRGQTVHKLLKKMAS